MNKERYIGESKIEDRQKKKLSLIIADKAITFRKLANDVLEYISNLITTAINEVRAWVTQKIEESNSTLSDQISDVSNELSGQIERNTTELSDRIDGVREWAADELEDKQPVLIDGITIKTINDESILGSGNITIENTSAPIVQPCDNPRIVIIEESDYEALEEKQQGVLYFVVADGSLSKSWGFGDKFPIILSGNWKFGDSFPIELS